MNFLLYTRMHIFRIGIVTRTAYCIRPAAHPELDLYYITLVYICTRRVGRQFILGYTTYSIYIPSAPSRSLYLTARSAVGRQYGYISEEMGEIFPLFRIKMTLQNREFRTSFVKLVVSKNNVTKVEYWTFLFSLDF